jgi:threonine/homoserine/homoserine lactone efflux protein|tara:strand:+ start:894 stop:1511 length:618 start_codon:yes stop_codon:yes gene_type:complete
VDFNFLTPITIGFFTAFIMGPVFWVLLETSITKGFKAAVAFDLGVMFADACFIGVCYLGSFQLLEDDQNKQGLFVLGGTILLLYGLFSWINRNKKSKDQPEIQETKENYFGLAAKGFAINILNVGVFIFWGGVTIVSSPASGKSFTSFVLFFSIVLLSYFITDLLKISVANRFKSLLTGKGIVIVNSIVSLILIVSGVVLILKGA